jgi:uncharacterized phage protein (TIGR02220 family)
MKDPAFIFYPGDYLRDTQTLSERTQVAYDRIMCEHMRNICISQLQLKFFTKRLSEDEIEELLMVLTEVDGGYCIEWVVESINKRRAYSESRKRNRQSKKKKDINNTSKTYVTHMENENENENIRKEKGESEGKKFKEFIKSFNKITGRSFRGDSKTKGQFNARIREGFSLDNMMTAINNCMSDPYHKEHPKYLTPEFITRPDKLQKYLNYRPDQPKNNQPKHYQFITKEESDFS